MSARQDILDKLTNSFDYSISIIEKELVSINNNIELIFKLQDGKRNSEMYQFILKQNYLCRHQLLDAIAVLKQIKINK
jgi:hypothetical protein